MTGVYLWGWGNGGSAVVFWGWSESYDPDAEEALAFVPAIVIGGLLTAAQVTGQGVSVSVMDGFVAKASAGDIQFQTVPERVTAKSAVVQRSEKSVKWSVTCVSGPSGQVGRSVIGGAYAPRAVSYGSVEKSCSLNEIEKTVKK